MRVLVCGSRDWTDEAKIRTRFWHLDGWGDAQIIHGACRGADMLADSVAKRMGMREPEQFPADWDQHGKPAGPIRNREMLDTAPDLVIAFHPQIAKSKGTFDLVMEANRRGIPVEIWP